MEKLLKIIVVATALFAWLFFYFPTVKLIYEDRVFSQKICNKPITYSIESIDKRFELSKEEVSVIADEATGIWELARNSDLFKEVEVNADIAIILKFDERQKITNSIGGLTGTVDSGNEQIELQRLNYTALQQQYSNAKSDYEYSIKKYYALRDADQGTLQKTEQDLIAKGKQLEKLRVELNTYASSLNEQVSELNTKINTINSLQEQRGESFNEGEYVQDKGTRIIYVYEFESRPKLVRLLAHEFGHTLGLEHVGGTKSIMNEINGSSNLELTKSDIDELNRACSAQNNTISTE